MTVIFTFLYQEVSFDRFHRNQSAIYRIHSGGYGVTPLCFGDKIKNRVPGVNSVVRFSATELLLTMNEKEFKIEKAYFTDPEVFQVFSFGMILGNNTMALDQPFSIVISRSVASRLYGNLPVIGESVRDKNGNEYRITGVIEDIPNNSHIRCDAFISIETLRRTQGEAFLPCTTRLSH